MLLNLKLNHAPPHLTKSVKEIIIEIILQVCMCMAQ